MDPVLIDANLGLALVLPLPYSDKAQAPIGSWFDQGRRLLVPVLWEYEIASALQWSRRLGQSKAHDGQYLAAAQWAGAEFWTADARLAQQARRLGALWVHAP